MSEVKVSSGTGVAARPRAAWLQDWRQYVVYAGFLIIFLFFAITLQDRGFLHANNLLNIARQTAMVAVMAVTMTFVLSAGEIDLSVGSVAGLASVVAAMGVGYFGLIGGILGGLATGIVMGLINGLLTTAIGIPSFLVTLAMMGIATGTAMWISNTAAIPIIDRTYNFFFGSGNLGPVPTLLVWMAIFAVIGHIALRRTSFGRKVLATGGSEGAARYSGVDTRGIKLRVLLLSALAASVAGMGEGDELSVIAAAVLGGTSLFGGRGTVIGSIVGALMIGLINNGLILMGLEYSQQLIARGIIILLAVAVAGRNR
jgi:ribose transport system permease protein